MTLWSVMKVFDFIPGDPAPIVEATPNDLSVEELVAMAQDKVPHTTPRDEFGFLAQEDLTPDVPLTDFGDGL